MNSDSVGTTTLDTASDGASDVTAADVSVADSAASAREMQTGTVVDGKVPSVTSSVTVMIGNAKRVSADSDVVLCDQAVSSGPQISTAGSGSVILTLKYSPLTVKTVSDDQPSVPTELTDSDKISSTADLLSDTDLHSSAASQPSADNIIQGSPTQRFVDNVCIC